MAGSRKQFELLFKLKASLGGDYKDAFKQAIETQKQLKNSIKNVNSVQQKVNGFVKQSAAIRDNQHKLELLNEEHERLQQKMKETAEPTETLRRKLERNENQIQQTTAKIKEEEKALNSLKQELRDAGIDTENLGEENARLQRSYEKLKTSQDALKDLNDKQKRIQESVGKTKAQLAGTMGVISAVATAVYVGPVKSAMALEQEMKNVGTLMDGDVTAKLAALQKEVVSISNDTGIGTSNLTDGLYQVISAFGETAESAQQLEVAAKAAKAGGATTTDSINLLSAVTKGYGDVSAEAQQKAADLAFQTVKLGQTSFPELASSIGQVIPLAATLGTTQEDLFGAMATLTGVTGGTSEVTTQLKATMQGFLSPSANMTKALKSMGYESGKALLESEGLQGALDVLKDSVGGDELAFAKLFSSVEAQTAVLALAGTQAENFTEKTKQMYEASGAAQRAYETATDSTEARMQKAGNSVRNLGIVIGQTLLPMIGTLADEITPVITKIAEFAQENPELVKTVVKVAAGLAAARVGFLGLKLAGLAGENSIINVIKKLVGLRGKMIENAATGVSFAQKISGAGKGLTAYFKNVGKSLGGVGSAIGNIFSGNAIIGKVTRFLGGIRTRLVGGITGLAGKAAGALTGAGAKMLGYVLAPFKMAGGKLGAILSGWGGKIAASPIGKIGGVITSGISKAFKKASSLFTPIGKAAKSILGPIGTFAKSALGPLGGIAGKVLPIVGVFTAVVTVVKLVKDHLQEIRGFIQKTFGDEALAVFDKVVAVISSVGETIKNIFSDGNIGAAREKIQEIFGDKGAAVFDKLVGVVKDIIPVVQQVIGFIVTNVVPVAEQIFHVVAGQVIPGIVSFFEAAAPVIMQVIQSIGEFISAIIPVIADAIAGIMPVISDIISFISTYVLPIVSEIFGFITSTVLPVISGMIQDLLPVIQNVLQTLIPAIQTAVTTVWNVISPVIQGILSAVQVAMPTIQSIIASVVNAIGGIIGGMAEIFNGIITFISGVFTGNWRQAWDGVKSIFSGIWETIKSIATGAVNAIISIINGVIGGLNKLKIPDWVPGLGGKGIDIPLIPMLAKGSTNTPDTFIAGEAGPELITNAPGRTVFTAAQTRAIITGTQTANTVSMAPVVASGTGVTNNGYAAQVEVHNTPTIIVNGDQPGDLEEKLAKNNERLIKQIEDMLKERADKEERQRYD